MEALLAMLILVSRTVVRGMPGSMVCIPQFTTIDGKTKLFDIDWEVVYEPSSGCWTDTVVTVCMKPDGLLHCFFNESDISSAKKKYRMMAERGFNLAIDTWSLRMSDADEDLLEFTSSPPECIEEQLAIPFEGEAPFKNLDWHEWRDSIKNLVEQNWKPPFTPHN
jgi:hypothetical protein